MDDTIDLFPFSFWHARAGKAQVESITLMMAVFQFGWASAGFGIIHAGSPERHPGTLNGRQPLLMLMLIAPPVLFLPWQVKMSAVKKAPQWLSWCLSGALEADWVRPDPPISSYTHPHLPCLSEISLYTTNLQKQICFERKKMPPELCFQPR